MNKKQENKTVKSEEFEKLQTEFDSLRDLSTQLEAQLKRAIADYHNLENRVAEGRSELTKWASGDLIMRILPTLDHLEQALNGASEADRQSGWFRGVELAVKEFKKVLEEQGLEVINIQIMDEYDPKLAEAVEIREGEDNKVLDIVQNGYNINGKVIRPAKVVVGKKEKSAVSI